MEKCKNKGCVICRKVGAYADGLAKSHHCKAEFGTTTTAHTLDIKTANVIELLKEYDEEIRDPDYWKVATRYNNRDRRAEWARRFLEACENKPKHAGWYSSYEGI